MADCGLWLLMLGGRCGPQPNTRLLLNYGFVDEDNPYDKLFVKVSTPHVLGELLDQGRFPWQAAGRCSCIVGTLLI